ncbi:hypothetical protein Tco_1503796 [Tanacetum coccineum]
MLLYSWDKGLDVCVDLTRSSDLTQTGLADFVPGHAAFDATRRKRLKYEVKCTNIGYGFLPFSFSSFRELEKDVAALLKRIRKFSVAQDIGAWSSTLTQTGMVDFVPCGAVIKAAQRKRVKYEAKCANIGYRFIPFSFSSFGELDNDAVTLLKRIQKYSVAQDIGTRAAIYIFSRISFAIARGVEA